MNGFSSFSLWLHFILLRQDCVGLFFCSVSAFFVIDLDVPQTAPIIIDGHLDPVWEWPHVRFLVSRRFHLKVWHFTEKSIYFFGFNIISESDTTSHRFQFFQQRTRKLNPFPLPDENLLIIQCVDLPKFKHLQSISTCFSMIAIGFIGTSVHSSPRAYLRCLKGSPSLLPGVRAWVGVRAEGASGFATL